MGKVRSAVTIARPVDDVYAFLLDLDRNASDPDTASVTKEPDGPTSAGTTFRFRDRKGGETSMVFTALEPNRRIDFEGIVGPLRPKGAFLLEPGDGTRLSVEADANPQGALRFASPVVNVIGKRIWDKRLARIKSRLEGTATAFD